METLMLFWHDAGAVVIALLLGGIALGFAVRFVLPAWQLGRRLQGVTRGLNALADEPAGGPRDPERIAALMASDARLLHLWGEYRQTLHAVNDPKSPKTILAWRATAMAEDFFTERALVDTPLKTEFYKHLPGILTGIGIIGTFSGLIAGLAQFDVASDPAAVRSSLGVLIQGVAHAFVVSAAAITLAMLMTWIEKSLVTRRYREVETLVQCIDRLFDAGVGEEYLARLVRASEHSAAQSSRLQQALVAELRQGFAAMLTQHQATAEQQQMALAQRMADALAASLSAALREPLERASGTLESAAGELTRVARQLEKVGQNAIDSAAGKLDQAGQGVGTAAQAFALSSTDLAGSAEAMAQAARSIGESLTEQREAARAIARMVGDLRLVVDGARRETALSADLVNRIEAAAQALKRASSDAEVYLHGVSGVLQTAHTAFADNVENTLARSNNHFQHQVTTAVESLKGAIEELSDALAQDRTAA